MAPDVYFAVVVDLGVQDFINYTSVAKSLCASLLRPIVACQNERCEKSS